MRARRQITEARGGYELYAAWLEERVATLTRWSGDRWVPVGPPLEIPFHPRGGVKLWERNGRLTLAAFYDQVLVAQLSTDQTSWLRAPIVASPVAAMDSAAIEMNSQGELAVAWGAYPRDGEPGGVYVNRMDPDSRSWVFSGRLGPASCTTNWFPHISFDSEGLLLAAFISCAEQGNQMAVYRERDDGNWTSLGSLNGFPGETYGWVRGVTVDAKNRVVVSWYEENEPRGRWTELVRRLDSTWESITTIPEGHLEHEPDGAVLSMHGLRVRRIHSHAQ